MLKGWSYINKECFSHTLKLRSFWLGLAYVLFPLNLLVYGLNAPWRLFIWPSISKHTHCMCSTSRICIHWFKHPLMLRSTYTSCRLLRTTQMWSWTPRMNALALRTSFGHGTPMLPDYLLYVHICSFFFICILYYYIILHCIYCIV